MKDVLKELSLVGKTCIQTNSYMRSIAPEVLSYWWGFDALKKSPGGGDVCLELLHCRGKYSIRLSNQT